ncbi:MAG: hypothetical protein ACKOOL_04505 [Novosphingobium sp.]
MSILTAASLLLMGMQAIDPGTGGARTGSRLDPDQRAISNADTSKADATMYRFIECAVTRHNKRVRGILDARSEEAYAQAQGGLDDVQRCNFDAYVGEEAATINFTADRATTRGFVAEAYLKRDRKTVAALVPLPIQRDYPRDWYVMTNRAQAIDEMAVCVADINPQGISILLGSDIGSGDQKTAIAALMPAVGQCLSKTVRLKTNALGLRTALAEALYHRAYDAPQNSAAGVAQ